MVSCPFCNMDDTRILARNQVAFAVRDKFPVNPGHTLVIPWRHVASWFETTEDERTGILSLLDQSKAELDAARDPPHGYNLGVNMGEAAGQTVIHLHVHLIPRYRGDVEDPRGGVRHVVPERGNYLLDPSHMSGQSDV